MQISITDGVDLILIPTQQFKTNRIVVSFMTELADVRSLSIRTLLSNLLETSSSDFPTQSKTALELSKMYGAGFGTTVNRHGNIHMINFVFNCIDDKFLENPVGLVDAGFTFLKKMILNPLAEDGEFDQETFLRQKQNLIAYVNSIRDNKQSYASLKLQEGYFNEAAQKSPVFGSAEELEKLTSKDVYDAYLEMIKNDRIQILVSGDIDENLAAERSKDFNFAERKPGYFDLNYAQPLKKTVSENVEKQKLNQSKLDLGYRLDVPYRSKLHYAALIFNGLFGGSPLSKLFVNVREKESLAYYASSSFDPYRQFLMVQTGIQSANKEHVIQLIADQLKALAIGDFEDVLVENVKSSLINNFESRLDNQMTAVNRAQNDILTGTYVSNEDWIRNVLSVSKAEIMEVASKVKLQNIYFLDGANNC